MILSLHKKPIKHADSLFLNIRALVDDIKSMEVSTFFTGPIDEVRDDAPGYYSIIKNPMDLSLISKKLINRQYRWPIEVLEDFRVIFRNCRSYYAHPMSMIREKCDDFEAMVLEKWNENAQVLRSHGIEIQTEEFDYSHVDHIAMGSDEMFQEQQEQAPIQNSLSYDDISMHSNIGYSISNQNINNFQTISHPSTYQSTYQPQYRPYYHINPQSKGGNSFQINLSELIKKAELTEKGNIGNESQEFKMNKMQDLFGSLKDHGSKKRKFDHSKSDITDLTMEFQEKTELKKIKMENDATNAENQFISILLGQQNKNMNCEDL